MASTNAGTGAVALLIMQGWEDTALCITRCLEESGIVVKRLNSDNAAVEMHAHKKPALVFLAEKLPDSNGLKVLERLRHISADVPIVLVLSALKARTVVKAMSIGAFDCLTRRIDRTDVQGIIEQAMASGKAAVAERDEFTRQFFLESTDNRFRRILELARRAAASAVPVVISGESGVGKEVLARYIHSKSPRREGPFVKVNCAALPTDLLESELFGYERGAFTGAIDRKPGKFELADGGTILLDEIGEFSLPLQPKLLHVLQDGEFTRLGGTRPVIVDARVIAATNRDLETAIALGEFRQDLFYRLNVVCLRVPPLRERPQDIPALCDYFAAKHRTLNILNREERIPKNLVNAFCRYSWPGNVRQLENAVKQYLVLQDEDLVLHALERSIRTPDERLADELAIQTGPQPLSLKSVAAKAADEAELKLVQKALERSHWNRKQVARELNISYKSLLNKVHKWEAAGRLKAG